MTVKAKKIAVGVGIAGAVAAAIYFFMKDEEPEQPPPDLATLWGIVTDADTGARLAGIDVTCNSYSAITDGNGRYEIAEILPGMYTVTFIDPQGQYEPKEV